MKKPALILVVREFDKFSLTLAENGFETINFPAIQTVPIEDLSELETRFEKLNDYDGLFFTSPKAAEVFLETLGNKQIDFGGKVYVLGNRTKALFENTNFEIAYRATANTAEELMKSFDSGEFANKKFLFLRGDKSLRVVSEMLKEQSLVDEIVVYRTRENTIDESLTDEISERLLKTEIEWICFFSPSGVENFVKKFSAPPLNNLKIAAIGATTAAKIAENNLTVEFVSPKANAEDFAFGLIEFIKNN